MKRIIIGVLALGISAAVSAQDAGTTAKDKDQDQAIQQDEELVGDENESSKEEAGEDDRSSYRRNRVSGNPNNRTVEEGSRRESESQQNTNESSNAVPAVNPHNLNQQVEVQGSATPVDEIGIETTSTDTVNQSSSGAVNAGNTVTEHISTGSGSPAMPAGDSGRDGTNNKQSAEPNMAGSKASGLGNSKNNVDENQEIRKGTQQQAGSQNTQLNGNDRQSEQTNENLNETDVAAPQGTPIKSGAKKKVAGPESEANNPSGKKQPIDSEAENTNGRPVDTEQSEDVNVPAMDTGEDIITNNNSNLSKKEKREERRKKRRDKRNRE